MSLTAAQQEAVTARGNVLVVAGAGTGKTRTLVERCLDCLLNEKPRASLDELLIVTFTEAAAAEMRQRIRTRLEEESALHPDDRHWQEQLGLFETAHIGTLHSFCLKLIRQHFYEVELDPQLGVLSEEEARLLAEETLDQVLLKHYEAPGTADDAIRRLIQVQGRGRDQAIRALVLRLHHYSQTLPDPAGWLAAQLASFDSPEPDRWIPWLSEGLVDWRRQWSHIFESMASANPIAANCLAALKTLGGASLPSNAAAVLEKIAAASSDCPRGKKTLWLKPLREFLDEAAFLGSLLTEPGQSRASPGQAEDEVQASPCSVSSSPADAWRALKEDWTWIRGHMSALLDLAREFTLAFCDAKRGLGMVDFHDLEQHALRLLWDSARNQPTGIARQWRDRLRFIFVDEYQDINAAQDKIIESLSRDGSRSNRFLVGDIKQSIYRFRLANPYIFQHYAEQWRNGQGKVVPLVQNFRSREGILSFINSFFTGLMRRDLGGVPYDEEAALQFGAPAERRLLSKANSADPTVELHVRIKDGAESSEGNEDSTALAQLGELAEAEKEARVVGLRLRELKAAGHPVWDERTAGFRPVEWSDMAILLRAPANKVESYAKEFARLDVPLEVAPGGFYECIEVLDILSLLQLLDNPLQDLPLIAVLHSPIVGLSLDELAEVRLAAMKTRFWNALLRWEEGKKSSKVLADGHQVRSPKVDPSAAALAKAEGVTPGHSGKGAVTPSEGTYRKIRSFLDRYAAWRRIVRQVSLSRCLELILAETLYDAWLFTQPRGPQRRANVQRLLHLAQQFDSFQRQGLFRFLRFIEAQQRVQSEPEVPVVGAGSAVRLMSIHQSKGLEFPVVAVADLGKAFNRSDLRADVILDETYGLCPQVKPPHTGTRYPSLPYWLARRRQARELLGEELRLLYVAMTRARDLLLLSATVSQSRFDTLWSTPAGADPSPLLSPQKYSDWLGLWFARNCASSSDGAQASACRITRSSASRNGGQNDLARWYIHDHQRLIEPENPLDTAAPPHAPSVLSRHEIERLRQRLSWQYPLGPATLRPAKTSVSLLRRQAAEAAGEAVPMFLESAIGGRPPGPSDFGADQAIEVGNAHHLFLESVSLDRAGSPAELRQEAERLACQGTLSPGQADLLDFEALAAFWSSDLGRKIRSCSQFVRRELPFTVRFPANDLGRMTGAKAEPALADEFVVVQGVADLAVILPAEIWLVDFKTGKVAGKDLPEKVLGYEPQLKLYAGALSKIYRRPVSQCWLYFLDPQTAVPVATG